DLTRRTMRKTQNRRGGASPTREMIYALLLPLVTPRKFPQPHRCSCADVFVDDPFRVALSLVPPDKVVIRQTRPIRLPLMSPFGRRRFCFVERQCGGPGERNDVGLFSQF